ncbi:MAG: hypothetical protein V1779_05385 [bacterium]
MKYIFLIFVVHVNFLFSQTYDNDNKQRATDKALEAIKLMDEGKIDESIILLKESILLDSSNYMYPYELGYAYYIKKDYPNAILSFEKTIKYDMINDQCYQMLGNAIDLNGDSIKAVEIYKKGLERFPKSGKLYLELGNIHQGNWMKAIEFYEKGIEVEPSFSSNYYWAALFYCATEDEVWGVLYGEIFMNLERGSKRTEKISKLLFDTYKQCIVISSDTSYNVSFAQNTIINTDKISELKNNLPYGLMVYEPTMCLSIIGVQDISLSSLNSIRKKFVSNYKLLKHNVNYPNIIFSWHEMLIEKGFFDYYNYWLFMKGATDEFNIYYKEHSDKFQEFINWFKENPLVIDDEKYFHRKIYN